MRFLIVAVAVATIPASAFAQVQVQGHVKRDGTYVAPHVRTTPNSNRFDNFSTKGNTNPYTLKQGTQNPLPPIPKYKPYVYKPAKPR